MTPPASTDLHSPPPSLLVVDDDRFVRATLASGLRTAGFDVLEAESGAVAIELGTRLQPSLALIDQRMPEMTGLQVAARLTAEASVPFIFLTACSDREVIDGALAQGALAYLIKPLDLPQVVPAIQIALTRAREIESLRMQALQLDTAVRQRREVSTAIGLLMAHLELNQTEAIERLRHQARSERLRMEDLARSLVEHHEKTVHLYRRLGHGSVPPAKRRG